MNPELQRYLWLELTRHRLLAAPAVVLLVCALFAANAMPGEDWRDAVFTPALALTFLVLHVWGAREAARAVTEEVRDRTWDLQRLSALGPWAMTWGKLLGSTVFPWYAGGLCLLAAVTTGAGALDARFLAWLALAIVAFAVLLHGMALATSLVAARKDPRSGQRFGALLFFVPVFLLLWVSPIVGWRPEQRITAWYGLAPDRMAFVALSAVAFAAWGVFGAYRAMCRELQVRTLPWAWPAFSVFVAAWLAGFGGDHGPGHARAFVAFGLVVSVALTYAALFGEVTTAMVIRRTVARLSAGEVRRALEEIPVWPATLVLSALFALAAPFLFTPQALAFAGMRFRELEQLATHLPVALVLLAARDCAILVFFASAPRPGRVEAVTLVYLVLLTGVLPALLAALGLSGAALLLLPFASLDATRSVLVMGVQAALAIALAAWRWRRNHGRPPAA